MKFDGALLSRGFWIYAWKVTSPLGLHVYVGRTGDSSSPNASSPFNRIGQHLDSRKHAKGNSIGRLLRVLGVEASVCQFEMTAIGPLFPEEADRVSHRPVRDRVAGIERCVAELIRSRGYEVIGKHGTKSADGDPLMPRIVCIVEAYFPPIRGAERLARNADCGPR